MPCKAGAVADSVEEGEGEESLGLAEPVSDAGQHALIIARLAGVNFDAGDIAALPRDPTRP